jgi:flavin reductase (DIM6/NTAB) family NADH-FMN oxidoreductase RutF
MDADPESLPWKSVYKILIGSVVPRPIAWVSSVDSAGGRNLAPFSFFNVVASRPPMVVFTTSIRSTDGNTKDTLRNVRSTGEFVVNIVTEPLAEAMNVTSTEFPPDVDEFEAAGVTPVASIRVRPPGVAESPVRFECRVHQIVDVGADPGGGSLILGRVVHLHVDPQVMLGEDKIDPARQRPIGRLAGSDYCRTTDVFQMVRPPSRLK